MRPLDSRLRAERDSSAKYSTRARSRVLGLSAASRAIPTSLAGWAAWAGSGPVRSSEARVAIMKSFRPTGARRGCSCPRPGRGYFRFLFASCQAQSSQGPGEAERAGHGNDYLVHRKTRPRLLLALLALSLTAAVCKADLV